MIGHPRSSLWHMILAPTVWAVHFVAIYGATAVICAKTGAAWSARLGVLGLTVVALTLILLLGLRAWRQWNLLAAGHSVHDAPSDDSRREFLGHAGWLLALVSAIGVVFNAMPALFIRSCL